LIKTYDEKLETQKFKFGVIYQKRGQVGVERFTDAEPTASVFRLAKKNSSITNGMDALSMNSWI
jgi:hypothetical protein